MACLLLVQRMMSTAKNWFYLSHALALEFSAAGKLSQGMVSCMLRSMWYKTSQTSEQGL